MSSRPQGRSGARQTVRSEPACDTQKLGFCPLTSHLRVGKATGQEQGCLAGEASGAEVRPTLRWPRRVPWVGAVSVQRGGAPSSKLPPGSPSSQKGGFSDVHNGMAWLSVARGLVSSPSASGPSSSTGAASATSFFSSSVIQVCRGEQMWKV